MFSCGPTGGGDRPRVPWRVLLPTVLIPNLINSITQGIALTAAPLAASETTGSYVLAAGVVTMLTLGQLLSTLPAGWLVDRLGERASMIISAGIVGVGGGVASFSESFTLLALGTTLIGAGVSVFAMARHAWITLSVPPPARGRTLGAVAAVTRLGILVGPLLAAAVFHFWSGAGTAFVLVAVASLFLLLGLLFGPRFQERRPSPEERQNLFAAIRSRRSELLQLGLVVGVMSGMRTSKRALVPLIGVALGWNDASIALLIGLTGAVDFAVCYLGGILVDRYGRSGVGVGTLISFALSHFSLFITLILPDGGTLYAISVTVMAICNGVSGGLVPTIGSDLADPLSPAAFLSSWRLVTDSVGAAAPIAITAIVATLGLGPAALAMGAVATVGAALLPHYSSRYLE